MMVVLTERSSSLSRDFCLVPISSPFPCPCFYLSLFHPSAVSWFSNFFTPPGSSLAHTSRCCKRMNEQSGCRFSLWSLWPIAPQLLCNRYPSDHTMTRFLCSCLRAPKHPKYSFFPPLALLCLLFSLTSSRREMWPTMQTHGGRVHSYIFKAVMSFPALAGNLQQEREKKRKSVRDGEGGVCGDN